MVVVPTKQEYATWDRLLNISTVYSIAILTLITVKYYSIVIDSLPDLDKQMCEQI